MGFIKRLFFGKKKEEELPEGPAEAMPEEAKPSEITAKPSALGLPPSRAAAETPEIPETISRDKDMQIILTKLDLINARLETLDRRLQTIEEHMKK